MSFVNILSQFVESLDDVFHRAEKFNFHEVQLINSFFMDHAFDIEPKNSSPSPSHLDFIPYIFWEYFSFTFSSVTYLEIILHGYIQSLCLELFTCFCTQMPSYSSTIC
jgi:hypothetical protein